MKHIGFRIPVEEYNHVKRMARTRGQTVSEFFRTLSRSYSEILSVEKRLEAIERDNVRILRTLDILNFDEFFRAMRRLRYLAERANLMADHLIRNSTKDHEEVLKAIESKIGPT